RRGARALSRAGPRGHGRVGQDAGGLVPLRGPRPLPRRLVRRPPAGPERDPRRPRLGLGPRLPLGASPSGAGAWDRLHGGARPPDDLAGMARAGAPELSGHPLDGEPADVVAVARAYADWLTRSPVPKLFVNGDPGFLLTGALRDFCRTFPNQQEVMVRGTHFVQEDSPDEIGRAVADFVAKLT